MRNKADHTVKTSEGINMLHVAAQGDQAYSLTYFKYKGLSIMSKDKERSTPLHWACCAGSDTASYYLQSWGVDVNAVDFLGYTPLHLAVRYSNRFPNTRTIKELLIKGADRDATERSGLKPIDLVETLEDNETKDELKQLLVKPRIFLPCCHFRTPMVKIERTNKCVVLFLALMLMTFICNMLFVYPCKFILTLIFWQKLNFSCILSRYICRRMVPDSVHDFHGCHDFLLFDLASGSWLHARKVYDSIRETCRKIRGKLALPTL